MNAASKRSQKLCCIFSILVWNSAAGDYLHEEHIEPVSDVFQSYWGSKSVDEAGSTAGQLENAHAFCSHIIGENLARIDWLHRCKCDSKYAAKYVDERNRGAATVLVVGVMDVACSSS